MKPISVIVTLSRYAVNRFAGGRGECVLKSTVCGISAHVSSMLFNTLPFYTF